MSDQSNVTPIDPLAGVLAEAQAEIEEEMNAGDKSELKASLRRIQNAERIVAGLRLEHDALIKKLRAKRNAA
jgi:hypothetical protein